ncbi:hypothetical protein LZZ85_02360 [Terrimonas sp. NA20]|uniref:Uncharacterized protein n=1 Tax=Terrimonas ginsenosidimutans TaxID=2908004 RepID=A0ABS9KLA7_9BACT|nr:hypothetical protein [Terrimonas ginsenosidimutans]MCG2613097.1 hypothetical protein [Terrimonas ginsenosidimutans]
MTANEEFLSVTLSSYKRSCVFPEKKNTARQMIIAITICTGFSWYT